MRIFLILIRVKALGHYLLRVLRPAPNCLNSLRISVNYPLGEEIRVIVNKAADRLVFTVGLRRRYFYLHLNCIVKVDITRLVVIRHNGSLSLAVSSRNAMHSELRGGNVQDTLSVGIKVGFELRHTNHSVIVLRYMRGERFYSVHKTARQIAPRGKIVNVKVYHLP